MTRRAAKLTWAIAATALAALFADRLVDAQLPQAVGEWAAASTVADARIGAASATLPDGLTLVAGGRLADGSATASVVVYDPAINAFTTAGQLSAARVNAAATRLADGRVVVIGGEVDGVATSDIEVFDVATGVSTTAGTLAVPRAWHAAATLKDGSVLVVGGSTTGGTVLATTELFDPETGAVTASGAMATARAGASATTLIDWRVLVAGGNSGTADLATAEIYDPYLATFEPVPTQMSQARAGHTALLLPHNAGVIMAGGFAAGARVTTTDLFLAPIFPDPYTYGMGAFVTTGQVAQPRAFGVGGPLNDNGYAFVAGGGASTSEKYRFATIKTDKDDYAPGEQAMISGSGWQPGETVALLFQEDPAVHPDYLLQVVADQNGDIYWDQWAPEEHDLNVRFYLTAQGSQSRAQMTFTDGVASVTITSPTSASPVTVAQNGTLAVAFSYDTSITGATSATARLCVANNCNGSNTIASALKPVVPGAFSDSIVLTVPGNAPLASNYRVEVTVANSTVGGPNTRTGSQNNSVVVTGATTLSLAQPSPLSVVYNSAGPVSLTATLTATNGGGGVSGATIAFTIDGSPAGTAVANASGVAMLATYNPSALAVGPRTVQALFAGATISTITYAASTSATRTLTVTPKVVTATVTAANKPYDGSNAATISTCTIPGKVGVEDVACTAAGPNAFADASAAGGKTVTATNITLTGTAAGNYTLNGVTTATTTANITKAPSVTAVSCPANVTYNGIAQTPCTAAVTRVGDPSLAPTPTYSNNINAGTATASYSYPGDANHDPSSDSRNFTIDKATATVVVTPYAVTYDGNPHTATVASIAGVNGETGATVGTVDVSGTTHTNAGTYSGDTWSFTGAANYNNIYATTITDTINKANATIVVTPYTATYDGSPHTATVTSTTGVNAETGATVGTVDVSGTTHTDAGTYDNDQWTFTGTSNYNNTSGTVADAIAQAPVTATAGGGTSTYDGGPKMPSACAVTGLYIGALTCANNPATVGPGAGTTSIAPVVGGPGLSNFTVTSVAGSYTIAKAATTTTVTCPAGPFTFNGDAQTPCAATVSGAGGLSEAVTVTYSDNVNAGTATAAASYAESSNHLGSTDSETFVIAKAAVTATAGSGSTTYDGATHAPSACVVSGPYTGGALCTNTPASVGPQAGTTAITPDVSGIDANNFTVTSVAGSYTISKAATTTTVSCPAGPFTYNGAAHTPCAATVSGAGGLSEAVTVTYSDNVNAGTATVTASYAESTNHLGSTDSETFVIAKAAVTATAGSGSTTYDGATHAPSACVVSGPYTGGALCTNTPASVGPQAGTTAITPDVSGIDANNFTVTSVAGSYTIAKAATTTTVTCQAGPFTFNGDAQTPCAATVSGAGGLSEAVTVTYSDNVNAGTATATASYAESSNHLGSTDSETFVIAKAAVTATAGSGSTTYDGATHAPSACVVSGPYTGGALCTNTPASVGPQAGTTAITPDVSGIDANNFTVTSVAGSYTIAKAATTTTVTCQAGPFTFNGDAQTPCAATVSGAGGLSEAVTVTYSDNVNAGTATATASYAESTNHLGSTDSETFVIAKAAVTATAGSGSTTYDGATHAPSACVVSGPYTGGLACTNNPATVGPEAGTTSIAPVVGGPGLSNFTVTSVAGSYTISQASSTTVVTCPADVVYTGAAQTPCTVAVTGVGGLSETPAPTYTANVNVGTVTVSYTYAGDLNHTGSTGSATFAITQAPVTATAGGGAATYDGTAKTPSACLVTGAYTGDLACANNPATVGPNAGTTVITPVVSGSGLTNFNVTSVAGSYTISKAATTTTVTCQAGPFTYNGDAQTPCAASVTGAGALSEAVAVTYSNNVNAGTATAAATYAESTNHLGSTDSETFVIAKAAVTATAGSGSTTYDGATHAPSACVVSGPYTGGALCTNMPASVGPDAGATPITPDVSSIDANNFTVTLVAGSYTVGQASSATVVTCPASVVYTGAALTPCTVAVTGAGGLNLTPTPTYTANVNVGAVTASYTFAGNVNHTGSTGSATFAITQAPVTATAGGGSATYDGSPKTPSSCVVTGAYTGNLTCTNSPASVGPNAGTTPITPVVSGTGLSNFAVTAVAGSYTISQASSTTVVTCPASVVYTGAALTPCTASYSGAGGLSGALSPTYLNNLYPGSGTANASYAGDANHTSSSGSATFAIGYGVCSGGFGPGGIILQPINSDGSSVYQRKGGSTIPVKFTVCGASGLPISDPAAVFSGTGGALTMLSAVRATVTGINEDFEPIAIPDVAFRWAGDKWIFNMATSNLTPTTIYTFRINLRAGSPITFKVGIK